MKIPKLLYFILSKGALKGGRVNIGCGGWKKGRVVCTHGLKVAMGGVKSCIGAKDAKFI